MLMYVINVVVYIAIFLSIIGCTLIVLEFVDRWFSMGPLSQEFSGYLDVGEVARAAGLMGMNVEERRSVLKKILVSKPFILETKDDEDIESQPKSIQNGNENGNDIKVEESEEVPAESNDLNGSISGEEDAGNSEIEPSLDSRASSCNHDKNVDTRTSCVICLDDYGEGQLVIKGNHCPHMFHESCIMEWLEKNDVCPFCRKLMITPKEFRSAAMNTLDSDRIYSLVRAFGQESQFNADLDVESGNGNGDEDPQLTAQIQT